MEAVHTTAWIPASTSLDAYETSRHPLEQQSHAQTLIHAPHADRRAKTIDALHNSRDAALTRRAERLGFCCCSPFLNLSRTKAPTISPARCRDRLCPHCQQVRARETKHRLMPKVAAADALRFTTLTQRMTSDDPGPTLDRLLKNFTKLRHRVEWKRRVKGGSAHIEVTRGANGDGWHVHLHLLLEGDYFPQKILQDEWTAVVGELAIADIRAIPHRQKALNYVTGYVAKGIDCTNWPADAICTLAKGLHRRRLTFTFGTWTRTNADPETPHDEPNERSRETLTIPEVTTAIHDGRLCRTTIVPLLVRSSRLARMLFGAFTTSDTPFTPLATPQEHATLASALYGLIGGPRDTLDGTQVSAAPPDSTMLFATHRTRHL